MRDSATRTPSDKRTNDALSINSGLALEQAVERLAIAAGCQERLDDGSHCEDRLWFVVRALCTEADTDYDYMVAHGRAFAARL